ncbi:uncharacterized protein EV420DRAFT_627077 [Desarmillaria tabescens]|uniref:Uncharacterized protein n=1 Tax=Armillaria tabescens TaxID=1929756 RepID=A0AA39N0E3_ARMTA|nr:uncharacterized protein EV420DRAFT_627077 [Desarmillaria tabescens]KAK0452868.1 hypothetical protein EV420DRAFT_627077 [Desarmillaria tabescens]
MPPSTVLKAALSCCSTSPACSICPPSLPNMSKHPVEKIRGKSNSRGFDYDKRHCPGLYEREWASIEDFQTWLLNEQRVHGIKFVVFTSLENVAPPRKRTWLAEHIFYCSRHKRCIPKYVGPNKSKSIEDNCFCSVRVKTYPDTPIVQGYYSDYHSHPLGPANATLSEKLFSSVRTKLSRGASKSDVPVQTDDTRDEFTKEYDSSVEVWRPESALYLDVPDPFASMSMIDVHPKYIQD